MQSALRLAHQYRRKDIAGSRSRAESSRDASKPLFSFVPQATGSSTYKAESRRLLDRYSEAFEQDVYLKATGGFVLVHRDHDRGDNFAGELFVSRTIAERGARVLLLSEKGPPGTAQPDAEINDVRAEIKEIRHAENVANAVQKQLWRGRHQAPHLLVYLNQAFEAEDVTAGMRTVVRLDGKARIKTFTFVFEDGTFKTLSREEVRNGKSL